jgi:glycosyltransferase involved in cell wall biosynthesis
MPEARPPTPEPRSLSVVVPVFNEEENVALLVERIVAALRPLARPFELIVVDDGSSDGTLAALRALLPSTPELVAVQLRRNFGQTAALQAGFDRARGDWIVTLDGDLQNDPADIPRLLERIEAGADVVSGWRRRRQDTLLLRKLPSWAANRLIRLLTRVPIHDQGCSLKAYRREVVEHLALYSDMHRFIVVLAMGVGASIEEVEVRHHPRLAGRSKYGLSRVLKVVSDLFTIRMLTGFQEHPTRWFALMGLPFFVGAVVCGLLALPGGEDSVVLPAVSLLMSLVFAWCVLAGWLGELIMASAARGSGRRTVFRELQRDS